MNEPLWKVPTCSGISMGAETTAVIWLISLPSFPLLLPRFSPPVVLPHGRHLSLVYTTLISPSTNGFPWSVSIHTHTHTHTHARTHAELIGVTLAWQEAQCHYANDQSITGQRVNTLSVIFDAHICALLMATMRACYLHRRIISASLGWHTAIYLAEVNCVIVGLPRIRATGCANRDI